MPLRAVTVTAAGLPTTGVPATATENREVAVVVVVEVEVELDEVVVDAATVTVVVPVRDELFLSVAVTVWLPVVVKVTEAVRTPLSPEEKVISWGETVPLVAVN